MERLVAKGDLVEVGHDKYYISAGKQASYAADAFITVHLHVLCAL